MKFLNYVFSLIFLSFSFQLSAEVFKVHNEELINLLNKGVPIIDIRTEEEWTDTGVIEDSELITFFDTQGNFDINSWMSNLEKVANKNEPVILICRSGRRSNLVATFLSAQANYVTVFDATGGMNSWIKSGNTTVKPKL